MNKIVRSLLLQFPRIYEFIYKIKNNYQVNYYLNKVHEPDFKAFNLLCSDSPQLFLDIGANVGMSALSIFTVKSNAKVISFEPNLINYPYLDKLVNKFNNFQYMKVGLGDMPKSLDFYYPVYNNKPMTALGSCDRQKAASWLNKNTVYFFDANKLKIAKITIDVKTLDSFNLQPDFIKIDVEGFEYQVLLGSEKTINDHRPILLIEGVAKDDKVHQQLKNWKYAAFKFVDNRFYLDEFDCDNNFFIPQEKMPLISSYLNQNK
ncbi:MAG: FkbM family methyltransferase [Waterburya sp.]